MEEGRGRAKQHESVDLPPRRSAGPHNDRAIGCLRREQVLRSDEMPCQAARDAAGVCGFVTSTNTHQQYCVSHVSND